MVNFALPSNGIIKSEHWKLVSSHLQEENRKMWLCQMNSYTVLTAAPIPKAVSLTILYSFTIEYFFEK